VMFFAYIGFDAVSTAAQEAKNPQRDMPIGILASLVICTVLYIAIALVLTGVVKHSEFEGIGDPLAYVFSKAGVDWMAGIVAVSAVVAMATVLLVFQLGQPRIWMAMSRDGLLPPIFSSIHPKFKTPWFSTIITGLVVAIPSLFMNLTEVTELSSIGTLFAFVLVCGGVLLGATTRGQGEGGGEGKTTYVPYINSRYIAPVLFALILGGLLYFNPDAFSSLLSTTDPENPAAGAWEVFRHKIPLLGYFVLACVMTVRCVVKRLSLIPVLGLMSCAYLMSELDVSNWLRFLIWLAVGLVVYFLYGYKHSLLGRQADSAGN